MSQRAKLAVLFVALVIDVLGIGIMLPVVPMLVRELTGGGIGPAAAIYGWLISVYALMQFLFGPAMGALSDRFGRRPVLLLSMFGFGIDYLLLAVAPALWVVVVARIVGGIMGATVAAASAYIADITPPERRAQNFGLLGAAFGIGFVAGPLIGGVLGEFGSRLPFYAASAASFAAFVFAFFLLPESLAPENRRPFRLREANPVGGFLVVSRHRVVLVLLGVFFLSQLAERMLEANWVLFTAYRFDWGAAEVGLSLAFVGILFVITQGGLVRYVAPRVGERVMLTGGLAGGAVCMLALGFVVEPWMVYAVATPYVLAWGLTGPAIQAVVTRAASSDEQGILQGAVSSAATATGVIGPPLSGALFAWAIAEDSAIHLPGIAYLVGSLILLSALFLSLRPAVREAVHADGRAHS